MKPHVHENLKTYSVDVAEIGDKGISQLLTNVCSILPVKKVMKLNKC